MPGKFDKLTSTKSDSKKYVGVHSPTRAQLKFPF